MVIPFLQPERGTRWISAASSAAQQPLSCALWIACAPVQAQPMETTAAADRPCARRLPVSLMPIASSSLLSLLRPQHPPQQLERELQRLPTGGPAHRTSPGYAAASADERQSCTPLGRISSDPDAIVKAAPGLRLRPVGGVRAAPGHALAPGAPRKPALWLTPAVIASLQAAPRLESDPAHPRRPHGSSVKARIGDTLPREEPDCAADSRPVPLRGWVVPRRSCLGSGPNPAPTAPNCIIETQESNTAIPRCITTLQRCNTTSRHCNTTSGQCRIAFPAGNTTAEKAIQHGSVVVLQGCFVIQHACLVISETCAVVLHSPLAIRQRRKAIRHFSVAIRQSGQGKRLSASGGKKRDCVVSCGGQPA
jgi:hypothetical protein